MSHAEDCLLIPPLHSCFPIAVIPPMLQRNVVLTLHIITLVQFSSNLDDQNLAESFFSIH